MSDAIDGTARWSGEHWINYIRRPGELADSGSVSLFHTRYSEAGEGNVAFVDIPGAGLTATCTDNRELAAWLFDLQIRGRGNQFDRDLPMLDTQFWRGGDVRTDPSWRLEAGDHELVSQWRVQTHCRIGVGARCLAEARAPTWRPRTARTPARAPPRAALATKCRAQPLMLVLRAHGSKINRVVTARRPRRALA